MSFLHELAGKLDQDGGPPVEEFMARDASFLQDLDRYEAEDFIEYHLYTDSLDKGPETLTRLKEEVMAVVGKASEGYIWHWDPFQLRIKQPKKDEHDDEPHLVGYSRVGENIDDEWFITYLLFHLTERLHHPWGLTVAARDLDGQYMLIEAADALPSWLGPENSQHRLWIREGKTHLIDLHHAQPSPRSALALLRQGTSTTLAPSIQAALTPRLSQYPNKAKRDRHGCTCLLPTRVAHILQHQPGLIAPAIRALCHRDHRGSSTLTRLAIFDPRRDQSPSTSTSTGGRGVIHRRVAMTRWLYTLLIRDHLHPPKAWVEATKGVTTTEKANQLGAKITVGFELLYHESKARQGRKDDPRHERLWKRYVKELEKRDYFVGLLPGSKAYKEQMERARQGFTAKQTADNEGELVREEQEAAHTMMDSILNKKPAVMADEAHIPDDDEKWMDVAPGDLDTLLAKYGTVEGEDDREGIKGEEDDEDIARMVRGMQEFMGGIAGLEGAEVSPDGVHFDVDKLMNILGGKGEFGSSDLEDSDEEEEEGSVDEPVPVEEEDKSSSRVPQVAGLQVEEPLSASMPSRRAGFEGVTVHEVMGADSDDEVGEETAEGQQQEEEPGEGAFMTSYMDTLEDQLKGTTLGESFERAQPTTNTGEGVGEEEELRPVDVDMNLVMSLLESYSRQEGQPGPVSNLLGQMSFGGRQGLGQGHESTSTGSGARSP